MSRHSISGIIDPSKGRIALCLPQAFSDNGAIIEHLRLFQEEDDPHPIAILAPNVLISPGVVEDVAGIIRCRDVNLTRHLRPTPESCQSHSTVWCRFDKE